MTNSIPGDDINSTPLEINTETPVLDQKNPSPTETQKKISKCLKAIAIGDSLHSVLKEGDKDVLNIFDTITDSLPVKERGTMRKKIAKQLLEALKPHEQMLLEEKLSLENLERGQKGIGAGKRLYKYFLDFAKDTQSHMTSALDLVSGLKRMGIDLSLEELAGLADGLDVTGKSINLIDMGVSGSVLFARGVLLIHASTVWNDVNKQLNRSKALEKEVPLLKKNIGEELNAEAKLKLEEKLDKLTQEKNKLDNFILTHKGYIEELHEIKDRIDMAKSSYWGDITSYFLKSGKNVSSSISYVLKLCDLGGPATISLGMVGALFGVAGATFNLVKTGEDLAMQRNWYYKEFEPALKTVPQVPRSKDYRADITTLAKGYDRDNIRAEVSHLAGNKKIHNRSLFKLLLPHLQELLENQSSTEEGKQLLLKQLKNRDVKVPDGQDLIVFIKDLLNNKKSDFTSLNAKWALIDAYGAFLAEQRMAEEPTEHETKLIDQLNVYHNAHLPKERRFKALKPHLKEFIRNYAVISKKDDARFKELLVLKQTLKEKGEELSKADQEFIDRRVEKDTIIDRFKANLVKHGALVSQKELDDLPHTLLSRLSGKDDVKVKRAIIDTYNAHLEDDTHNESLKLLNKRQAELVKNKDLVEVIVEKKATAKAKAECLKMEDSISEEDMPQTLKDLSEKYKQEGADALLTKFKRPAFERLLAKWETKLLTAADRTTTSSEEADKLVGMVRKEMAEYGLKLPEVESEDEEQVVDPLTVVEEITAIEDDLDTQELGKTDRSKIEDPLWKMVIAEQRKIETAKKWEELSHMIENWQRRLTAPSLAQEAKTERFLERIERWNLPKLPNETKAQVLFKEIQDAIEAFLLPGDKDVEGNVDIKDADLIEIKDTLSRLTFAANQKKGEPIKVSTPAIGDETIEAPLDEILKGVKAIADGKKDWDSTHLNDKAVVDAAKVAYLDDQETMWRSELPRATKIVMNKKHSMEINSSWFKITESSVVLALATISLTATIVLGSLAIAGISAGPYGTPITITCGVLSAVSGVAFMGLGLLWLYHYKPSVIQATFFAQFFLLRVRKFGHYTTSLFLYNSEVKMRQAAAAISTYVAGCDSVSKVDAKELEKHIKKFSQVYVKQQWWKNTNDGWKKALNNSMDYLERGGLRDIFRKKHHQDLREKHAKLAELDREIAREKELAAYETNKDEIERINVRVALNEKHRAEMDIRIKVLEERMELDAEKRAIKIINGINATRKRELAALKKTNIEPTAEKGLDPLSDLEKAQIMEGTRKAAKFYEVNAFDDLFKEIQGELVEDNINEFMKMSRVNMDAPPASRLDQFVKFLTSDSDDYLWLLAEIVTAQKRKRKAAAQI